MPPSRPEDDDDEVVTVVGAVVVVVVGDRRPVTVPSRPPLPEVVGVVLVPVGAGAGVTEPVGAVGVVVGSGVVVVAGAVGALTTGLPEVEPVLPVLGVP